MLRFARGLLAAGIAVAVSACSLTAPQYTASLDNVQALKNDKVAAINVGAFTSNGESGNENPISLRGSSLESPYNANYADYLAEALKQELSLANLYAQDSKVEVSGVLMKNDLDAGMSTGAGTISARFIVTRSKVVRYDQIKSANIQWDSSFAGAVAIPKAQQSYPALVQALLAKLFSDPAFAKAAQ